jgi:hypothetical protein
MLGAVGAGVGAAGTLFSGLATSQNASYQAAVAQMNAQIANQNAARAVAAGQQQATVVSQKGAAELGQVVAGLAANNIDVNSGSAVRVEKGTREESQLSSETALTNAELQAYGYKTQAAGDVAQAGLETAEAEEAPIGAGLAAGGGLLSNISSIGFKFSNPNWYQTGGSSSIQNPFSVSSP